MGITKDPAALLRWMVAGPEVARVVHEFMALQEGVLNVIDSLVVSSLLVAGK